MDKSDAAGVKRSSFSGKIGYVLAAAGSAVGLGNIWRFPYLAAKYGGGSFLVVYLVLTLTFGYTMIMSESALGRMTRKSPVGAFKHFSSSKASKFGGWINAIIPLLIVPYYSVIGGWVFKYLFDYITGDPQIIAGEEYFSGFIGNAGSVVFWFVLFAAATMTIIFAGVENGVEKVSKLMMPILIVLAVIVASYSVTRPGAIEGVKYFFIPNIHNFSWMTVVAALGQMFYSLSIAMGILYTFGSYMKKDFDIEKATGQVELFDTGIAILAGLMIIPAVFAFSGGTPEALGKGPSLMFVTLPQVFASMGAGKGAGIVFFMLVLFAALTSSVALAESCVSTFQDEFKWSRNKAAGFMLVVLLGLGLLSCLGFNLLSGVTPLGMDILSFFDFMTNSVMMPVAAASTCLLILHVTKIETIEDEIRQSSAFKRYTVYRFVLKYLAILFLAVILLSSVADALGIIKI
ncbi:MAG: sodium-dependent transporter [Lachnospiraceae bacterium]|nr:sodium-dependent transporter [Lachnospiraceae bacterium]